VGADAVTGTALVLTTVGALFVVRGHFAIAAPLVILGSLGDALDGVTARTAGRSSQAGALFDAAADRYQEAAVLGALALHVHDDVLELAVVLAALVGSFMVSYGSAKAEALRVAVPGGAMRRLERAICLGLGLALVPLSTYLVQQGFGPGWLAEAPILLAVAIVAVVGNVSAVVRLRAIAVVAAGRDPSAAPGPEVPHAAVRHP
jgi:CDP-diacylglycerol--glycerol-3-phosphate 3-phosphatidyltransferase